MELKRLKKLVKFARHILQWPAVVTGKICSEFSAEVHKSAADFPAVWPGIC